MAKQLINSLKLGIFVVSGLLMLIFALYLIGKDNNLFGSQFLLRAQFVNVNGLVAGNNVRYAGIEIGTVKSMSILQDTIVEVTMTIDQKMKTIIRKSAIASIGSDGLIGNKIINITSMDVTAPFVENGDLLAIKKSLDTDEMLKTLNKSNQNIAVITEELKQTVQRINASTQLTEILNDPTLSANLRSSLQNVRTATQEATAIMADVHRTVNDIQSGKGSVGALLNDTSIAVNLEAAAYKIKGIGENADRLSKNLEQMIQDIDQDLNSGNGVAYGVLKDSAMLVNVQKSLANIEQGTASFSQNMEALKQNFLFRRYFKRQEKKKKN